MNVSSRASTDPRISRRRKAVQRGRRRRILWRTAVALAVGVVVWVAFFSPLLKVKRITITGARHTSREDIARSVGLDSSDNLLLISTSSIATQTKELPWVKRVEVARKLPGTVRIRVIEREPSMVLSTSGRQWMLDAGGRVLGPGDDAPSLPVIAGSPVSALQAGARVQDQEVTGALAVFRSLPPSLRAELETIFVPTVERLTLSLKDGTQIRYGAAEDLKSKNEVLGVLLRRLRSEGGAATYLDVRVPERPAAAPLLQGTPSPAPTGSPTATPSAASSP